MNYVALTSKNVQIPVAFRDRAHALQWAEDNWKQWPGGRLAQRCADGRDRTVVRFEPEKAAA